MKKSLHLVLKAKWFDMIASGGKSEEYREIKDYWTSRIFDKEFDTIIFHRGYTATTLEIQYLGFHIGYPKLGWAENAHKCYILKLGDILTPQ